MCGRYLLLSPAEAMRRLFGLLGASPNFPARYNVAPTDMMPVVRLNAARERELALLRWGLVPGWAESLSVGSRMINARSETVATKGAFRDSFKQRRCLVPADGYYEWKVVDGQRQPYLIRPPAGDDAAFLQSVAQGYRSVDPDLPDDWVDLARAVDLTAWVEFVGRPDAPDDLLDHARFMIDSIIN